MSECAFAAAPPPDINPTHLATRSAADVAPGADALPAAAPAAHGGSLPRVDNTLASYRVGLATDDAAVAREEDKISADGFSVKDQREMEKVWAAAAVSRRRLAPPQRAPRFLRCRAPPRAVPRRRRRSSSSRRRCRG